MKPRKQMGGMSMETYLQADKRGYLHEEFRLFHLKDSRAQQVGHHYHEFDKVVLFLGGKVTYVVEGVTYFLQPWDILLVPRSMIHCPVIDASEPYERMILWLGRDYLSTRSDPDTPLRSCFEQVCNRGVHLLRTAPEERLGVMNAFRALEDAQRSDAFGAARLADLLCQQLMILLNRTALTAEGQTAPPESYRVDKKFEEILHYIAANLGGELDVESLSRRFFLSRYYLMHRFKEITGYTVQQYIRQKRILKAGELIRSGMPVMKAAEQVGYKEYSTFLRAFRAVFHVSPREFQ
jgi:AraC-like DNA-binding protein